MTIRTVLLAICVLLSSAFPSFPRAVLRSKTTPGILSTSAFFPFIGAQKLQQRLLDRAHGAVVGLIDDGSMWLSADNPDRVSGW
ncbi:hypothetical protein [Bradyrhizobium sp. USDA 4471]